MRTNHPAENYEGGVEAIEDARVLESPVYPGFETEPFACLRRGER